MVLTDIDPVTPDSQEQVHLPALVQLTALESLYWEGSYREAAQDQDVTAACIIQRISALKRAVG